MTHAARNTVTVGVNTKRAAWVAWGLACVTAPLLAGLLWTLWAVGPVSFLFVLWGGLVVLLGYGALFHAGLARRAPVGLRMDASGISGFYAEPARWDEIKRIAILHQPQAHPQLAFELLDPLQFFDGQTPWQRLTTWANGRISGFHIIVPLVALQDADGEALAAQARAFQTASRAAGQLADPIARLHNSDLPRDTGNA